MRKIAFTGSLLTSLALVVSVPSSLTAQGQQAIVIQGATLIDGNGGAPLANSVVVIQGNRIAAVGRAGQVQVPAGAQTINGAGKWIIPGLMDAKSNYYGYYGEGYLVWGVTSAFNSGGGGDVGQAERDAINHGIYAGPRLFNSVAGISGPGPDGKKADTNMPGRSNYIAHTPEEARNYARLFIDAGADFSATNDGDGDPAIFAAFADEAHKAGQAVVFRPMGPQTKAREAAAAGADVMIHTGNLGAQIAKDPDKWKNYTDLPPDAYSDMDEAKVPEMIKLLVDHHVALEPDLMATDRGFSKSWNRVQSEAADFFEDPAVQAYYPELRMHLLWQNVRSPETYLTPQQIAVRAAGFKNHAAFLKRYVQAGGHIVAASDIPQSPMGLGMHQEIAVMVEDVGLTPMQAIQAATKWVADAFRQKDLGSIEQGKFADLVILEADPTQNILNTRRIDTVIKDGKVVDRTYHPWFRNIFGGAGAFSNPVVEGVAWAAGVKQATFRGAPMPVPDNETSPTPGIESLMPYTVLRGSPGFTLTIKGFNFVQGSVAYIDNVPVPTRVVDRTALQAMIPDNLVARAGRFDVVVKNPQPVNPPDWGDTSNKAYLLVPFEFTTAYSKNRF